MEWLNHWKIILASASPRRAELLRLAGYSFKIRSLEVDENYPKNLNTEKVAEYLAIKKANVQKGELLPDELLIAADSIVVLNNRILGKPNHEQEAWKMLNSLSGKEHQVITGVCVQSSEKQYSFSCCSRVFMEVLSDIEIDHYVKNFKPYDKAGSYGIQEWIGINRIKRIEGSYTNIMGLPTAELYQAILSFKDL